MTPFENLLETILVEYASRDSKGEFDTWKKTDAFIKEKAEVLLAYVKEELVSEELEEAANNAVISLIPSFSQKNSDGSYVNSYRDCFEREEFINLFKAGAKWQKEQMMRKRN